MVEAWNPVVRITQGVGRRLLVDQVRAFDRTQHTDVLRLRLMQSRCVSKLLVAYIGTCYASADPENAIDPWNPILFLDKDKGCTAAVPSSLVYVTAKW